MHMTKTKGIAFLPLAGRGGNAAPKLLKKLTCALFVAVIFLVLTSGITLAKQQGELVLKITTEKEVVIKDERGKKRIEMVDLTKVNAVPGDEVVITLSYENKGKGKATGVAINYPIPEEMRYMAFSAYGEAVSITFSVDNGKVYDFPARLTVIDKEGNVIPAKPEDYTHIRWSFDKQVEPKGKGVVGFRTFIK